MSTAQFYLFTLPGDMCPVWSETFLADGTHVVAPTPHSTMSLAVSFLRATNPGAIVDELCIPLDIDRAREWARTMLLEQFQDGAQ
jgi:hypothetical protein